MHSLYVEKRNEQQIFKLTNKDRLVLTLVWYSMGTEGHVWHNVSLRDPAGGAWGWGGVERGFRGGGSGRGFGDG